jgi:hypothetical protein
VTKLRVTLHGNPNDPDNPYKILSDRFNTDGSPVPYQSQKLKGDTIEAMLQIGNCSHDFTMNLSGSKRTMRVYLDDPPGLTSSSFFNFDRVASVPITPVNTVADPIAADFWVASSQFCTAFPEPVSGFVVGKNPDGTYRDNYAGCAVDADGRAYVRRTVGIQLTDNYRLRFQNSPIDGVNTLADGTAYIRVYHYAADSTNNERWELVPDDDVYNNGSDTWIYNYGELGAILLASNRGVLSRVGSQFAPFKIIVEKLP